MAQVEQVLVVPRSVVEEVGMFHGLVLELLMISSRLLVGIVILIVINAMSRILSKVYRKNVAPAIQMITTAQLIHLM